MKLLQRKKWHILRETTIETTSSCRTYGKSLDQTRRNKKVDALKTDSNDNARVARELQYSYHSLVNRAGKPFLSWNSCPAVDAAFYLKVFLHSRRHGIQSFVQHRSCYTVRLIWLVDSIMANPCSAGFVPRPRLRLKRNEVSGLKVRLVDWLDSFPPRCERPGPPPHYSSFCFSENVCTSY